MAKSNANTARATESRLTLGQWSNKLKRAAKSELSAASKVYWAVIEARGAFDINAKKGEREVREAAKAAFEGAGMDKRSAQKRVSDAMALLKAPKIPGDAPANLQRAADAVRAERPKQPRKPRQPQGAEQAANQKALTKADMIRALKGTLDGYRRRAADEEAAALIDSMAAILADGADH